MTAPSWLYVQVTLVIVGGLIGYLAARLARPRRPHRCPLLTIKLRHQADSLRFIVGQLFSVDDALDISCSGVAWASGTVEGRLLVVAVDHRAGTISARPL